MKLRILSITLLVLLGLLASPTEVQAVIQGLNSQTGQTQTFQNDSNITISSSNNIHSLIWQGLLPLSRGGTGASSFTNGSIPFIFNGIFSQDNSNFFWDNTNKRLGIGTPSPTSALEVSGNAKVTSLTSTNDSTINSVNVGLGGGSVSLNTAIGAGALSSNTVGIKNVAMGYGALNATNANENTAIGYGALVNSLGEQNTAVGSGTITGFGSGSYNSALGNSALGANTSGGANTAIGASALSGNTSGSNNVAVGYASMPGNTGHSNVAVGGSSFLNLTGVNNNNVAIGQAAARWQADGSTPLTTANNSIYIGAAVQGYDNNDFNSIVIGTSTIGSGANKTVIGNSAMTDVYFGSASGNANIHAKKLFLGSSSVPGCIIMGDVNAGVGYITLVSGVLTVSVTPPVACQ